MDLTDDQWAVLEPVLAPTRRGRRLPFRIRVIQTDNGGEFQTTFHAHVEAVDIRHVYIRPRTWASCHPNFIIQTT